MFVSSANNMIEIILLHFEYHLYIYIRNRSGPSIDP